MGMLVWLSWIDDCAYFGRDDEVNSLREKMMYLSGCDDEVNMDKYSGCKINGYDGFNFTQPVM